MRQRYSSFLLLIFSVWIIVPRQAEAQSTSNTMSIVATAEVVGDIELETIHGMSVQQDELNDSHIYIDPTRDSEAGKLQAKGVAGAPFRVTFFNKRKLNHSVSEETLDIFYEVTGFSVDEQQASTPLDALEHELRFNEDGVFYFWVGGRVRVEEARGGRYSGEFTLEMEYH